MVLHIVLGIMLCATALCIVAWRCGIIGHCCIVVALCAVGLFWFLQYCALCCTFSLLPNQEKKKTVCTGHGQLQGKGGIWKSPQGEQTNQKENKQIKNENNAVNPKKENNQLM